MAVPRLVVLSGWPRSGKTRVARYLADRHDVVRVGSDDLREEYGMEWGRPDPRESVIQQVVRYRMLEGLMMERDVVVDTTGMFRRQRRGFCDLHVHIDGRLHLLQAERYFVSLHIDTAEWRARQATAGRPLEQERFYLQRFEPVTDEECLSLGVTRHLELRTGSELEWPAARISLDAVFGRGDVDAPTDTARADRNA